MAQVFRRAVPIFRYLDTVGDGSGTKEAIGNYSDAGDGVTEFKITPAAGEIFEINRMIISLSDVGSLDSDSYGNGITLTNGISVVLGNDTGVLYTLTNGDPIKTNSNWGHLCYDVNVLEFGQGNEHLVVRWTFTKGYGGPFTLDGDHGDYLAVILNDSFVGLTEHRFHVQGEEKAWY